MDDRQEATSMVALMIIVVGSSTVIFFFLHEFLSFRYPIERSPSRTRQRRTKANTGGEISERSEIEPIRLSTFQPMNGKESVSEFVSQSPPNDR